MTNTRDLAARLVPLGKSAREEILGRFPRNRQYASQLADSFGDTWYLHRGDLTIDDDFDSTLNLVVEGDLVVRGTIRDDSQEALLVVTGDLYCENLFSKMLVVVLGSLYARGVVYAEYNDWAFEVWGEELHATALMLDDKSALLPDRRHVALEWNSDSHDLTGDIEILERPLLRYVTPDSNYLRKEGEQWIDDGDNPLDEEPEIEKVIPGDLTQFAKAGKAGNPLFRPGTMRPAFAGDWRLDRNCDPSVVATKVASADVKERVAAASHPAASEQVIASLAADSNAIVRSASAHHPALIASAAAALAKDPDPDVRRQLAASVHAGPHLPELVRDPSAEVRRATASHEALDDELRRILLADSETAVKKRALRYLPVTKEWVDESGRAGDELLKAWSIEHAAKFTTKPADWRKGLFDERPAVREASLRNASDFRILPFLNEHAQRFAADSSVQIRRTLAVAARDETTLMVLAKDQDQYVRRNALMNLAAPEPLLHAAADRVAASTPEMWNTSHPQYIDLMSAFQDLEKHPRLPADAIRKIHRSFPRFYRFEPHRNMPLDVILDRAESLEASLAFEPEFQAWRTAEPAAAMGAFLQSENDYLSSCARMNAAVPEGALLAHARAVRGDIYSLRDIARNAVLCKSTRAAEELRKFLLDLEDDTIDSTLAENPDLPQRVLRELLLRTRERATMTLWQVYGVVG